MLGNDGLATADYCRADSAVLRSERPLLLNPELDVPENHLNFLSDGTVVAKTPQGESSIEAYFLGRDELVINRKKMTDDVVEKIRKHSFKFFKGEIPEETYRYTLHDLYESAMLNQRVHKRYSRVAKALFDDFDTFVVGQFPVGQQPYIRQTFMLYQQGRLWPVFKSVNP